MEEKPLLLGDPFRVPVYGVLDLTGPEAAFDLRGNMVRAHIYETDPCRGDRVARCVL